MRKKMIKVTIDRIVYKITSENTCTLSNGRKFAGDFNTSVIEFEDKQYTINKIEKNAFKEAWGVTSITIPASVTNIEEKAFYWCNALIHVENENPAYSSIDGILYDKHQQVLIKCPLDQDYITIPTSVKTIEKFAFNECHELKEINLPSTVTTIGDFAFSQCESLSTIHIPSSVTTICSHAFYCCTALKQIDIPSMTSYIGDRAFENCTAIISVADDNPNFSSSEGDLYNKLQDKLLSCPTYKTSINIPTSVVEIADYAFYGCNALTSINLPSTVKKIGKFAFDSCSSLTSIVIPALVEEINYFLFFGCSALTSITITSDVTKIEDRVFDSCPALQSFHVLSAMPFEIPDDIGLNFSLCTLYVPKGSSQAYKEAEVWNKFVNIIEE